MCVGGDKSVGTSSFSMLACLPRPPSLGPNKNRSTKLALLSFDSRIASAAFRAKSAYRYRIYESAKAQAIRMPQPRTLFSYVTTPCHTPQPQVPFPSFEKES